MAQYVKRNSGRRKKRRLKKSFIVILLVIAAIAVGLIVLSLRGCFSPSGTASGDSSDTPSDVSSEIVSTVPTYPESTSVKLVSPAEGPLFGIDSVRGGTYLNVGTDYIAEVVGWEAETLDCDYKDRSRPIYTPLPIGTVDYCSGTIVSNGKSTSNSEYRTFVTLRCGKQVYNESLHKQRTKIYDAAVYGALPETNDVTVISGGLSADKRYTTLTLDVDWKAPFSLELTPQGYTSDDPSDRDYTVAAVTYQYVDITFKYASKSVLTDLSSIDFTGTLFSGAEWRKNTSDYTLRLKLNGTGKFYGWYAEYDNKGDLVFNFLNPAKVSVGADGKADLTGVRVYLDVGHGGVDSGAVTKLNGTQYCEADLNLRLAKSVKPYLEAMGATVIMSRTDNTMDGMSQWTAAECMQKIRDSKPDFVLSIHHNDGVDAGFASYHYDAFSSLAANQIRLATQTANLYGNTNVEWHYYFGVRVMYSPAVLTENGYISNYEELTRILDDSFNEKRAEALANGIADYFKAIQ